MVITVIEAFPWLSNFYTVGRVQKTDTFPFGFFHQEPDRITFSDVGEAN
jgi:hypothetical protein